MQRLFAVVRQLTERGVALVFVSHKLDEVLQVAQTVTILRNGSHVLTAPAAELDRASIGRHMTGHDIDESRQVVPLAPDAATVLEVRGLTLPGAYRDVSFRLRHGEAVAVGMALSCSLAARTGHLASGDLDRLLSLLRQVDLPIYDPVCEPDVLWRRLRDEVLPHKAGQLHLVVPSRIGVGDFIDSFDQIDAGMLQDACADLRARTQGGQP